jgi:uncharacterized protein YjbI with pentapeptide repeats/lipoprotein-anchoring transpeptidase ErfK/SrfK/peptidoglycan hydrolase-like protein with peptidoglycan-binding domain
MTSQSKRGRLLRSATYRSWTDVSAGWPGRADTKRQTSHRGRAEPNPEAKTSSRTACDDASLASSAWDRRFGSEPDGSDFRYARLDQAELKAVDLSEAKFNHASLAGADFTEANLSGASFRFATVSDAGLAAADLSRSDLQLASFDRANLRGANLVGALLDHADFFGSDLANAKLKAASLRFATLTGAALGAADLPGADLRYARLNVADLADANLSGAFFDYADFSGANLVNANLCGAHLRYAKNLTPTQVLQARIDDSTVLPLHYREPMLASGTGVRARRRKRPLLVAALFSIGLLAVSVPVSLVWPLQYSGGQASPTVATAPSLTPTLASLTPAVLAIELRAEVPNVARRIAPISLAAMSLHPTLLARNAPALASDILPVVSRQVPAQRLRIGDVAPVLIPPVPEKTMAGAVPLERSESDAPIERLALATPARDVLSDAKSPLVAAVRPKIALRVREKPAEVPAMAPPVRVDPLMLVVSLGQQKLEVYRGTALVASSKISSGMRGYDTRTGVFSILEKRRRHHSNLYSGAPMPWMQRMTWSGTALHGGVLPGYPASHGCVRLPFSFAPKLFQMTNLGENVVVARDRVTPKPVEHPNLFQPVSAAPQVSLALADRGVAADADPIGNDVPAAPLRILITRRTEQDRIIAVQYLLASLGYLKPQNFTGRVRTETIAAIRAFQKANDLNATGAFTEDLAKAVYRVAGKAEPPPGHLYVRQDFRSVFDMPVALRNPERTLGTHIFTAMTSPPGSTKTPWLAVSLEGNGSVEVLDRVEMPDEVRREISERLTPGSSLIIAETSVNSALLREKDDFIVWTNDAPNVAAAAAGIRQAKVKKARLNRAKAALVGKPRTQKPSRVVRRRARPPGVYGGFWPFRRW